MIRVIREGLFEGRTVFVVKNPKKIRFWKAMAEWSNSVIVEDLQCR